DQGGEKEMEKNRKQEGDQAHNQEAAPPDLPQDTSPQCPMEKLARPCREERRHGKANQRKKFNAPLVSLGKSLRREVRRARVKRVKWQGKSLRDQAHSHTESVRSAK